MDAGDMILTIIFFLVIVVGGLKKLFQSAAGAGQAKAPQKPDFEASPTEVEDFLRGLQEARRQQGQAQARPRGPQAAPGQGGRARPRGAGEAPFWQDRAPEPENEEGPRNPLVRPAAPAVRPRGAGETPYWQGRTPEPENEEGPRNPLVRPAAPAVRARRAGETPSWQDRVPEPVNEEGPRNPLVRPAPPAVRPTRARRPRQDDEHTESLVATEPVKEIAPVRAKPPAVTPPDLKKINARDAVVWLEILGPPLSMRRRAGRGRHAGQP